MSFPLKSEPPKITFVGRPLDPNKGFITLLDALELLLNLPENPRFIFWILGGEPDEAAQLSTLINARPGLNSLLHRGGISVWGRVQRTSLPEFYKRSTLVIMPSHREPFGLVAIESMLCGCPVIGTKQGGLSDTIIHGITGVHADIDSPFALANAILLYLRSPEIRQTRGAFARIWAESAFSKTIAYDQIRQLYRETVRPSMEKPVWNLHNQFIEAGIADSINAAQKLLGTPIQSHEIIASRYHTIVKIATTRGHFTLKQFKDRPSLQEAVFPIGKIKSRYCVSDFIKNARFHSNSPYSPELIDFDETFGFVLYKWLDAETADEKQDSVLSIVDMANEFGRDRIPNNMENQYNISVQQFLSNPSIESLKKVDEDSLQLNSIGFGFQTKIRETHPQVELYRILMCFDHKGWAISEDVVYRLRMIVRMALELIVPDSIPIKLCHGDLKDRHIVKSNKKLYGLDTERAIFAVGSLDLGVWACYLIIQGVNPFDAVKSLRKISRSNAEASTSIQWLVYFLVFGYLVRLHHGDVNEPTIRIQKIIYNLSLAL